MKGHSGHPENERCDAIAKKEARRCDAVEIFVNGYVYGGGRGSGGYCAILKYGDHEKIISGSKSGVLTGNVELTAVIEALKVLKTSKRVVLCTSSKHIYDSINTHLRRWKKSGFKKTKNRELWKEYVRLSKKYEIECVIMKRSDDETAGVKSREIAESEAINGMKKVAVFACAVGESKPGPGGYGGVLRYGDNEKLVYGVEKSISKNRAILKSVVESLKSLKAPCDITLYINSDYVIQGVMEYFEEWQRNGFEKIKNADLWREYSEASKSHKVRCIREKECTEFLRCEKIIVEEIELVLSSS